jgi:hypothetical protein
MPTQPPIQWIPEALSLGLKRPGREVEHSRPPYDEVKEWRVQLEENTLITLPLPLLLTF